MVIVATLPEGVPLRICTPCPACGCASLFIGDGGHLVCSLISCPSPSVELEVEALKGALEDALVSLAAVPAPPSALAAAITRVRRALRVSTPADPLPLSLERSRQ